MDKRYLIDPLNKMPVVAPRTLTERYSDPVTRQHQVGYSGNESTPSLAVQFNRALKDKRIVRAGRGRWVEYILPDLRRVYVEANLRKMYLGRVPDEDITARVVIKAGSGEYTNDLYQLLLMRMVEMSGDALDVVRTADKVGLYVQDPESRSVRDRSPDFQIRREKRAHMSLAKAAQDSAHQSLQALIHTHNAQQQREHERAQARDAAEQRSRKLRRNLAIGAAAATGLAAAGAGVAGYRKGKSIGAAKAKKELEKAKKEMATPENWIRTGLDMTGGRDIKVKMGTRIHKEKTRNPFTGWRRTPTVKTNLYEHIDRENRFKPGKTASEPGMVPETLDFSFWKRSPRGRGPVQQGMEKRVGPGTRFGKHELRLALAQGRANNLSPSALRRIVDMHDTTSAQQSIAEAARVR